MLRLAGLGRALPAHTFPISDLATRHGADPVALSRTPGVLNRRYCVDETQVDLAVSAAQAALADAGIAAADLDTIISACGVAYQPLPSMAPLIMRGLDVPDGTCRTLDVNTTCLSFCSALDLATDLIAADPTRRILIVSAEKASRGLPWDTDPETAALFGDGAAAAVVTAGDSIFRARRFRTYPSAWEACQIASGGTRLDPRTDPDAFAAGGFFAMRGKDLFKITAAHLPGFVDATLAEAGWARSDIDLVIPHQASPLAIRHMTKACGFSPEQVLDFIEGHGNMIAASIPFGVSLARDAGRLTPGARVLIIGTSAGVAFGAMALEIGKDGK